MKNKGWRISPMGLTNLIMFVFLVGAVLSPFVGNCKGSGYFPVFAQNDNPLLKSKSVEGAIQLQQALREIYQEASPAVVRIETEQIVKMRKHPLFNDPMFRRFFNVPEERERKRQGLGSGFIISSDGYIVTNDHVVRNVTKITVKLSKGGVYEAKLVGSDRISDIALLKIDAKKKLKTVYVGDSDSIRVGDFGIAIGNPFGLESTFTMGVISSISQDVDATDGIPRIQTDAAINPGNSGGPLLNIKGEVIGINQMIYSQSGGSVGIGFAIPINYAKEVIKALKQGKKIKPGYIGVAIAPQISEDEAKELKVEGKTGLLVSKVELSSPAWKAGLRPYDFITEIDGRKASKFSILKSTVVRKGPGSLLDIVYFRDGKSRKIKIKVGDVPVTPER